MGLFSRKRSEPDVALPLPELDAPQFPMAVPAEPAAREEDSIDLSAFSETPADMEPAASPEDDAAGDEAPEGFQQAAPASDDPMALFHAVSFINPHTKALLDRAEDIPIARLLTELREVRARLQS